MKNKLGIIALILLATLVISGTAMAGAIRTDFTAWDIPTSGFSGGRTWIEDGVLYMRSLQYTTSFVQVTPEEDLQISGDFSATINANVNLTTGCGHVWGAGENESWRGKFQGEICFDTSLNPVSLSTNGVLHGQGELKGLVMRYTNVNGLMTGYVLSTPQD